MTIPSMINDEHGHIFNGTRIEERHRVVPAPQLYNVVYGQLSRPAQNKLHTTNSQTEEEVGGSETKQPGAKIQPVNLNHEKGTCLNRNMPENVKQTM